MTALAKLIGLIGETYFFASTSDSFTVLQHRRPDDLETSSIPSLRLLSEPEAMDSPLQPKTYPGQELSISQLLRALHTKLEDGNPFGYV